MPNGKRSAAIERMGTTDVQEGFQNLAQVEVTEWGSAQHRGRVRLFYHISFKGNRTTSMVRRYSSNGPAV